MSGPGPGAVDAGPGPGGPPGPGPGVQWVTTVRHRRPRPGELAVLLSPMLWPLAAALLTLIEADRLPRRFGTWWTADGRFVTPLSPWASVVVLSLVAVVGALISLRVSWLTPDRTQRRVTVFLTTTEAGAVTIPYLALVLAQAHRWRLPPVALVIGLAFVSAIAAAAVATRLVPETEPWAQRPVLSDHAPRVPLAGSERIAWAGGIDRPGWGRLAAEALSLVVLTWVFVTSLTSLSEHVIWGVSLWLQALMFGVAEAVATALALWLRVSVDARGLQVRCPLPWLRRTLPLEQIVGGRQVHEYAGFWGRGVVRTRGDGRTGLFVRSGPALEVLLHDGTVFAVTVDHPAEAAGVLNALVDRRRSVL